MTVKKLFEAFRSIFPWMIEEVEQYKGNRNDGGIDIYLETGEILNFNITKTGWILKGGR